MSNRLRLLYLAILLVSTLLLPNVSYAQIFNGEQQKMLSLQLQNQISHWEVYRLDADGLTQFVKNNPGTPAEVHLGRHHWRLELTPNPIISPDYTLQVLTPNGLVVTRATEPKAFRGHDLAGGGRVRLTLDQDFVYGFVEEGGERYYIEPLWYYIPTADRNLFLTYAAKDVNRDSDATCAVLEGEEKLQHLQGGEPHATNGEAESMACYQIDLAIASDNSMLTKYGSVGGVENHNIGVINDVEVDFSGNFNHDLTFNIVTQFVASGSDPWSNSTDPGVVLNSFRTWGNAGNFGVTFDLGEMWTNRDFDGNVIGIAFLNGVCNSNKYHCLQDFTSNSEFLRCLTSHEIGHNFSCVHDSGNPCTTIMCPSVSTSNSWSSNSVSSVNSFITPLINNGCLAPCGPPPAPIMAAFEWMPNPGCVGQPVQFTDLSTGGITGRTWTFTGGTPATSTQTNPTATWNTAGTFNVKLTLSGVGGPVSLTQQIIIQPLPVANFTHTVSGLTVSFTSTSSNATAYDWDFGDGGGSSDANPVHTYTESGIYTVKLTVTNACGSSMKTLLVNTAPTADFAADQTAGCAPFTVHFTNLSSTNAASFIWQFPGGAPSQSTQENPTVVYPTSGMFPVTLTASNGSGSSTLTKTNYIMVQNLPSSTFTYVVNGLTVNFTNTSVNATSASWNFGDGGTSTQLSPSHTYAAGGTYSVVLSSINACGTVTNTQSIVLVSAPVAAFTATPTSGCGPLTVQFSNQTTGGATTYSWQFPGGTPGTSSAANPSVVYNTAGTYSVTLTATNAAGSSTATQSNYVTVYSGPTAAFSSSVAGSTATFTNTTAVGTALGATTYAWNFGDNTTSTAANPTHTYAANGTYTVTLTATNSCGTSTVTHTVVIATPPTASFTANVTSGCAPLTVQFTSTSSANAQTFNWQFPGGTPSTSTAQNPTVVYNTAGTYSVTLTVSNAAGSNTATQTNLIVVTTTPTAAFTSTVAGSTATFTNTSSNATTYAWNFGDNTTSTATNPTHTYAADGTYTVTLTATNSCGNKIVTQTVIIVTPPTANFTANVTSGCAPLTVQFTSTSSANAQTFNWQFAGGTPSSSTAQNPTVVYNTAGTYSVTLTVSNAAGSNTATQTNLIVVTTTPTAAFSSTVAGSTATFTNTSGNATTYAWNFGDNTTSTATNPTHTYAADGTYTVTLTATNSCGNKIVTQTVIIVTPPTASFTANVTSGCAPLTVQFTSTSSANAQNFNWQFAGGTPSSSTAQNPTVIYNTAGTYSVTLTVSNAAGSNTATQTNLIVVTTTPTAAFTSTVAGSTATFTNTSTNATTYAWNFGDNTTSTAANPTHTYAANGTYTVTLTATNSCGSKIFTQTVVIVTPPTANFTANVTSGCAPLTVQFTSTSSANAQTFSWQFPGGTPSTSTAQNPSVVYNTAGTYSVTLTVSNAAGSNTATQTNLIVVTTTPTAAFTSLVAGATATFTNSSGNATTYAWNFGDNTTSTAANPTHTYAADGTYPVTLTATNSCGSTTFTQSVLIVTPPTANFTASNTSGCAPLTVQFTSASSANAQTFNWQFPGGTPSTSTAQNPTVVYNTAGTYSVILTVSNGAGSNTATQTNLIVVTTTPTAAFTSTVAGATAIFTNSSTNATNFVWDFGDGSGSSQTNPSHTYAADGTYMVILTATNSCGSTTYTQNVVIITSPNAGFTASTTTGCADLTVQFTDLSSGNTTAWSWTFPGGTPATSTAQNPTVVYSTPGVYDVTLVASTTAGSSTYTQPAFITVLGPPTAGFTSTTNGSTVSFVNTSSNASTYIWNFGDGSTSSDVNPTHTYVGDSMYTVILTATNNCGATTFSSGTDISSAPTAAFTVNSMMGCAPFTAQFTNQSSANATTYAWFFQGGSPATSAVANPTVMWTQAGTYSVQLIVFNSNGSDTASTTITVAALPAAAFTMVATGLSVAFTNSSANGTSYEWNFGDGTNSNVANPTHVYTAAGTYTVELTVSNACGAATLQQMITVTTVGAEEPNWLSQFRVYPNPNPGIFMVDMQGTAQREVEFTLYNAIGQLVRREVADFGTGNLHQLLDCSTLPAAIYTLRVRAGAQSTYVKIVIQK